MTVALRRAPAGLPTAMPAIQSQALGASAPAPTASPAQSTPWQRALFAAALLAVDPQGLGGIWVRARAGPVRDRWLEALTTAFGPVPIRRISPGTTEAQLIGGLDIGQTLLAGRPVREPGVLAAADGGVLLLAMAERVLPAAGAIIAKALDDGRVRTERDGVSLSHPARFALIALDEGIDESLPAALADRLGLRLGLDAIGWREAETPVALLSHATVLAARDRLSAVTVSAEMTEALCAIALLYGGGSLRPALQLLCAARAAAALRGRQEVAPEDAEAALWLVLGLSLADIATSPPEGCRGYRSG